VPPPDGVPHPATDLLPRQSAWSLVRPAAGCCGPSRVRSWRCHNLELLVLEHDRFAPAAILLSSQALPSPHGARGSAVGCGEPTPARAFAAASLAASAIAAMIAEALASRVARFALVSVLRLLLCFTSEAALPCMLSC